MTVGSEQRSGAWLALRWLVGCVLLGADAVCLAQVFLLDPSPWLALPWLAAHVAFSIGIGLACLHARLLREGGPIMEASAAALTGLLACFVPIIGPLGLLVAMKVALSRESTFVADPCLTLDFDPANDPPRGVAAEDGDRDPSALLATLRDRRPEAAERRFQALLEAQHVTPRLAVTLMKAALTDPDDETRLFAFSRLESWRNALEGDAKALSEGAAGPNHAEAQGAHLRLAEVHWELAFLGLAEGSVRQHGLRQALHHLGLASDSRLSSHEFLKGRILMELGEYSAASAAFEVASSGEYPRVRILPYLAECAFRERDFEGVRNALRTLDNAASHHAAMRPVIEFWR